MCLNYHFIINYTLVQIPLLYRLHVTQCLQFCTTVLTAIVILPGRSQVLIGRGLAGANMNFRMAMVNGIFSET